MRNLPLILSAVACVAALVAAGASLAAYRAAQRATWGCASSSDVESAQYDLEKRFDDLEERLPKPSLFP